LYFVSYRDKKVVGVFAFFVRYCSPYRAASSPGYTATAYIGDMDHTGVLHVEWYT
jgi:hypothetical protein